MLNNVCHIAIGNLAKRKGNSNLNCLILTIGISNYNPIFKYFACEHNYDSYKQESRSISRVQKTDYRAMLSDLVKHCEPNNKSNSC